VFFYFVYRLYFNKFVTFRKLDLLPSSGKNEGHLSYLDTTDSGGSRQAAGQFIVKNPGLLSKILCRGLVPGLSNFIDSYRSVIAPLSSIVAVVFFCCFIFLFLFYIDTAYFSFHLYLHFTFYLSDKYN
jgi:hypothetical protein